MSREIEVSRSIAARPQIVWQIITDIAGADITLSGVDSVEILTPGEYLPGFRWLETRKMFGVSSTQEMMVQESAPPETTTVYSMSSGTEYYTTFTLAPEGAGTLLSLHFSSRIKHAGMAASLMDTLFGSIALRQTEKMLNRDLADIANAAEKLS